ncbi:uncharacterized protein MONBRDRAFT_16806 [Monosiga brevicollis MX1]|uniref:ATP-dependent RNA helicase n=1 Tax=Monosiga brevicollis TaxID=81824 RepID=A9UXI8_MONBE|nr:uncharacterized protein MONBRDRAFT_16806 [Monosiga brevicollis MX1]EDQ89850.1 predicted protein [Monosiga brevicollis MX1]|eukprot:XP_001745272.1 hypothetical protein [Monosiga brevicollis MX1]
MPKSRQERRERRQREAQALEKLSQAVKEVQSLDREIQKFAQLPLSSATQRGLKKAGYTRPTEIQRDALIKALKGQDVLAAAKTGSGKTLAFLIPVLEGLFRQRWSKPDGVGGLIISPTRELALQTYEVLTKIGCFHDMSAGLVVGGTTLEREKAVISNTNIIICTPGRLLQHMDETFGFSCDNLQMLVLDEADRILDMGFAKTLNAILENLPKQRQTMLFSATQTKSVKDLARLSLKMPEFISVHEQDKTATPHKLVQAYMTVPLNQKLDVLFSFIRSHVNVKMLVFVSSCKQVRFIYETLRRMRPGVPLLALYGKQKQAKRVAIYNDFSKKTHAVLLATDIAARGLDFPSVDWVFQLDCPEDVATYIHRVGRTARYGKEGKALLTLLPSESAMVQQLAERKVEVVSTEANASKIKSITPRLKAFCAESPELKYLAQKCFISYTRSVFLQPNKEVFRIDELPLEEFALSLGLPAAPRIKFAKVSMSIVTFDDIRYCCHALDLKMTAFLVGLNRTVGAEARRKAPWSGRATGWCGECLWCCNAKAPWCGNVLR